MASYPFPPPQLEDRLTWLDRWWSRQVDRVVASGPADAARCRRLGLSDDKVARIAPGVEVDSAEASFPAGNSAPSAGAARPGSTRWPPNARLLVCVGPFEPHKGYRDAVWAFDILKFLYDDLHLVLIGDGPDRERLADFAQNIQATDRVHLLGCQPDIRPLLEQAQVVLVPSRESGGVNAALEAMAAGRPVVASRLPDLAEIVADGETGFLVPPAEQAALARQIRILLEDAALRERFGTAARQRARSRFAVPEMVRHYTRLYTALGVEPQLAKEEPVPGMLP